MCVLPTTRETRGVPGRVEGCRQKPVGSGCSSRGNPPHPGEGGEITSRCPCSRAGALRLLRGSGTRTKGEQEEEEALSGRALPVPGGDPGRHFCSNG